LPSREGRSSMLIVTSSMPVQVRPLVL